MKKYWDFYIYFIGVLRTRISDVGTNRVFVPDLLRYSNGRSVRCNVVPSTRHSYSFAVDGPTQLVLYEEGELKILS